MIRVGDFRIGKEERDAINAVLDSGQISEGKYVKEFEKEFAKKIGTKYCVTVNSGTSALLVGLLALKYLNKVPKGSKVITTPLTYVATSNALILAGLKPVYVDVNPITFDMSIVEVESLLQVDPKGYAAILPVHLMGYPCDMDAINYLAKKYNLTVFEDAAQAHGTKINGKNVGTMSLLADYSFYIAHNIQVGEMGAIVTDDAEVAKLIRRLKANGRACDCLVCTKAQGTCPKEGNNPRFTHTHVGYNFKTMEFQAALGIGQIAKMDEIVKVRSENVKKLNNRLKGISNALILPKYDENVSYLAYPIITNLNREELMSKLTAKGIESRPLFGCIPTQQPAYSNFKFEYKGKLKNAEFLGSQAFYIGCHQYITDSDIDYIGKTFEEILK